MSFVWPLGLAFGALLPLIAILYFLKLRRVPKIVSSTYLWKRAVDEFSAERMVTDQERIYSGLLAHPHPR